MVQHNHYPHNYTRSYGGNWDEQEHKLVSYTGDYRNLTPTIEQIMNWYEPRYKIMQTEHKLTEFNFMKSGKKIKAVMSFFLDDLDFDEWEFSDDPELNKVLTNKFWTTWLKKHWQHAINYGTYDMFLNELSAQLEEKMPVYGRSLKASADGLMWDNVSIGNSYNQANHQDISNGKTTGKSNGTGTVKSMSEDNSTGKSTSEDTSKGTSTSEDKKNNAFLDTPQNNLSLDADRPEYATNVTADKSKGSTETNNNSKSNGSTDSNSKSNSISDSSNESNTLGTSDLVNNGKSASDTQTDSHSRVRPVTDIARDVIALGFFNGMMDAIDKDGQLFTSVQTSDIQTNHWAQQHSGDGYGIYPGGRNPFIDNGGYY